MKLEATIRNGFLDRFNLLMDCNLDKAKSRLALHVLRIENNQFCYEELIQELSNAVITFALSRHECSELIDAQKFGELNAKALSKLRRHTSNEGEAGEILLYCFLEAHLNAPKILTKLELKTSSNEYVKGSDGIHLLRLDDNAYHLIFGESKLEASLTSSISEAFKSISAFLTRTESNIDFEIGLLSSQLCKEALDDDAYEFVKSVVMPRANGSIVKDNAFGIFAGFDLKITDDEKKLDNNEFRKLVHKRIMEEVEKRKPHIIGKIKEYKLEGYQFYVYAFPFIDLDVKRKEIIKKLVHSEADD